MQIQNQVATVSAIADSSAATGSASTSTSTSASSDKASSLANETTFLQLMVAQLKNQDPLQPTDGTQFLGQLAQFSQLEQLIGLRQDLKTQNPQSSPGTGSGTPGTSGNTAAI
jgi:flagellar basal-body rod modification protein FlgD